MNLARLWWSLILVFVFSFAILGYYGGEIYQTMPPVPKRVVTTDGDVLFTEKEIRDGQNVWQSIGGQEVGTIWGHGAYVAPDWNADWLHREAMWILNKYATDQFGKAYDALDQEKQAMLRARFNSLSTRERQVFEAVVAGQLNKQIAADLGAAERTVKAHRARVMDKMAASSVADLVHFADRLRAKLQ